MNKEQSIKQTILDTFYRTKVTIEQLIEVVSEHLRDLEFSDDEIYVRINSVKNNPPLLLQIYEVSRDYFCQKYHLVKVIDSKGVLIKVYF